MTLPTYTYIMFYYQYLAQNNIELHKHNFISVDTMGLTHSKNIGILISNINKGCRTLSCLQFA